MKLIVGSGRSGTTWVQDALAAANGLRPVFEPLHPAVSRVGAQYAYRALDENEPHPALERHFVQACAGEDHRMWTRYRGRRDLLLPALHELHSLDEFNRLFRRWRKFLADLPPLVEAGRRHVPLVKCIRANLMLGWLSRHLRARIVLIVRHPGAVIESQYRLGRVWDPEPVLQRFRDDSHLHELTRQRYRKLLSRRLSRIEALATVWVIENQTALASASTHAVEVVYYELLRSCPDREWGRIANALDLQSIPGEAVRGRPSQQSSTGGRPLAAASTDSPRWLRSLTSDQVASIQGVLDEAECDLYSMSQPEPGSPTPQAMHVDESGAAK